MNNPRFEAWRSQAGDDDLHLQVLGGERVLPRNLQKLLLGRIDVLLEDRDIIESTTWSIIRSSPDRSAAPANYPRGSRCTSASARTCRSRRASRGTRRRLRQLRREGTLKVLGERYRLSFE